jgi:hypothetical protein
MWEEKIPVETPLLTMTAYQGGPPVAPRASAETTDRPGEQACQRP